MEEEVHTALTSSDIIGSIIVIIMLIVLYFLCKSEK